MRTREYTQRARQLYRVAIEQVNRTELRARLRGMDMSIPPQPPEPTPPPVPTTDRIPVRVRRRSSDAAESATASRAWWDGEAADYQREHADVLGTARLMWGPEGIYEDQLGLLGAVRGLRVLEFGAGGAQGSWWCADQGAHVIATDISAAMLAHSTAVIGTTRTRPADAPTLLQCDAAAIPLADDSIDLAFSAYGALPFVADSRAVLAEVARVLRPGGRLVFSITHPIRWAFPDVPGQAGLTATHSYFDRRPYVEENAAGDALYVEHHRTLGDRVRDLVATGFVLEDLVEPEWPPSASHEWGGWSRLRGVKLPGTAIFCSVKKG